MKSFFFILVPAALILSACGGNKQDGGTARPPIGPEVDQAMVHRAEECPQNLSGEYADRVSRQRRAVRLTKDGDRLVLSDDRLRYFVTGEQYPRQLKQRMDGSNLYRAVCNQGAVRIMFFYRTNRGELSKVSATQIFMSNPDGSLHFVQQTPDNLANDDRTYDRVIVRPRPPVKGRPVRHR